MHLEIITPDKKLFEGEAKALTVPGSEGSLGILNHHAGMVASLKKGKVKVTTDKAEIKYFEIKGGVVEVLKNNVIVLAE
ncbi:MAG TPA: ATP synthase F1 subunit epsilon [Bacteroidia bacterium]|nr:ATP synthase F1 subunit epsilon [Bacteroidia bacterium]